MHSVDVARYYKRIRIQSFFGQNKRKTEDFLHGLKDKFLQLVKC